MPADFLDSNVLLYLFDTENASKRETAASLVEAALSDRETVISFQVVQEVLNRMTRNSSLPAHAEDVRRFLRVTLVPLWRLMPSEALYGRALDIQVRYRYDFYDSLIIAAALTAGCTRLLSEDLQAGQRIEGLVIENPFRGVQA
jgi:predicted nucleic acid-binding protein